jgi:molecular chaperone DnaK
MTYRLGVDVGTTFTAAAVANGAAPSMLGLGNRALQVPSVLFLTTESDFLVGEAAERRGMAEPDRLVREFKRRIGDPVPLLVAGMPFSPESLMAELLRWVVRTAADRMGERPTETVVTYPANWGPYKLGQLEQVVSLADIGPNRSCAEPVAAAAQYASRTRVDAGDRLAVYDLGGGTFDACVVEQTLQGFRLFGRPEGIDHLGGVDFDEAVFQHVVTELGHPVADLDPADPAVAVGLARLRRDVVEAKEALSSDVTAVIPVALPGVNKTIRITRAELETMIRPALRTSIDALDRAVRSAGLTTEELRAIVLVGGSSRIPLVRELLEREFGVPIAIDNHPRTMWRWGRRWSAQGRR